MDKINQINFDYDGKHYCLEYTPAVIKRMEAEGFRLTEIGEMPATRIEQLWNGAFMEHHRRAVGDGKTMEIYKDMKHREKLLEALSKMYSSTLNYLMPDEDDEGNVEWTASL